MMEALSSSETSVTSQKTPFFTVSDTLSSSYLELRTVDKVHKACECERYIIFEIPSIRLKLSTLTYHHFCSYATNNVSKSGQGHYICHRLYSDIMQVCYTTRRFVNIQIYETGRTESAAFIRSRKPLSIAVIRVVFTMRCAVPHDTDINKWHSLSCCKHFSQLTYSTVLYWTKYSYVRGVVFLTHRQFDLPRKTSPATRCPAVVLCQHYVKVASLIYTMTYDSLTQYVK
jgi:hypothetical protein